ncbi:Sulfotransferase domain [Sesbania bispinosa]|nr:Sulfotransferase domain [Sesbania bispinosa]
MASSNFTGNQSNDGQQNTDENKLSQECKELIRSLPREKGWHTPYLYQFQGIWIHLKVIQAIDTFQKHFQAKDSDVIVATLPKSGTTWLKALTFAIVHRQHFPTSENHPLLTFNPHQLVPFFEFAIYGDIHDQIPHLSNMTQRRLLELIFHSLHWPSQSRSPIGISAFGPFWNHMLSYWKESIARPDKVLFLKYEDLKEDVNCQVKRVAEFWVVLSLKKRNVVEWFKT